MIRSFALDSNWRIPKRYLEIKLFDGRDSVDLREKKLLSWLDVDTNVSFSTSASAYGMASQANVTIIGLKPETMAYLSTSYRYWTENPIYNDIEIDAGYENQHGMIYKGSIIEGISDLNSANFSISLKCISLYRQRQEEIISLTYKEIKVSQLIKDLAEKMGAAPVYTKAVADIIVKDYYLLNTSPEEHIRYLAKITGLNVFFDRNRLIAKKPDEAIDAFNFLELNSDRIIGAPTPTAQGCNVSIRMNPNVIAGQPVKLDSLRFPSMNGDYVIGTYNHTGETKGAKWTTNLQLIRKSIYENS